MDVTKIYPDLEGALRLASGGDYQILPLSLRIPVGELTPVKVMKLLKSVDHHCFMLESAQQSVTFPYAATQAEAVTKYEWGRYTFLGYDPILELTCTNARVTGVIGASGPEDAIRDLMATHKSPQVAGLPSFTGGLVGYFSYDFIKYSEPKLCLDAQDQEHFRDMDLMLFDKVIAFDHVEREITLIANIRVADGSVGTVSNHFPENYEKGVAQLRRMEELLAQPVPDTYEKGYVKSPFRPLFEKEQYCRMVERAKRYIYEGDIFQVVLSNRFDADFKGSLFDVYRFLRDTNPSPYMFYFSGGDVEFAGASPETLVKLEGKTLHTFPLAGTKPRGKTLAEDEALEKELLGDPKELSEHNMLVDLGRNDLGKISTFGSVAVENYLGIQRFSHVMHIGSTVVGTIREDRDGLSAIEAVLPAGTLSGAPKIRACEIINELENNKRGLYGGAIGYISFTGNVDTCIAIRLAFQKNGRVFVRSGAGIVADSVPEREYAECLQKAQAVMDALERTKGDD